MSEMVDRVKRAVRTAKTADEAAIAVIREMKVPSPEMLAAAAALPGSATPSDIFMAMMEAAAR